MLGMSIERQMELLSVDEDDFTKSKFMIYLS